MLADVCRSYPASNIMDLAGNAFNKVCIFTALSIAFAICGSGQRQAESSSDSESQFV